MCLAKQSIAAVLRVVGRLDGCQIAVRMALAGLWLAVDGIFQQPECLVPVGVDLVVNHDVGLDAIQGVGLRGLFIVIDHQPVPVVEVCPDARSAWPRHGVANGSVRPVLAAPRRTQVGVF